MKNTNTNNNKEMNITMEDIMNSNTIHTMDKMTPEEARTWGWEPAPAHAVIAWVPTLEADRDGGIEIWASWEEALVAVREVVDWTCGDPWIEWSKREAIAVAVAAQAVAEVRGSEDEPTWYQFRPMFAGDDDNLDRLIEAAIVAGEEEE